MSDRLGATRRDVLLAAGTAGLAMLAANDVVQAAETPPKTYRIGVVSAGIRGKPQPRNGHTWHFAQYLHPAIDFDVLKKQYPQAFPAYKSHLRNPKFNFDQLPFPDTRITHYYDADPAVAAQFAEVFPGV